MIVLVGIEKGGTGKSTIATNLAAWLAKQGRDVLIVDTDKQATSANWATERRSHPKLPRVHCTQRYGQIYEDLRDYASRYDEVVVDAGGRDSEELRQAMTATNVLISPLRPTQADLWTVSHLAKLVKMARAYNPQLTSHIVMNATSTNWRVTKSNQARELIGQFEQLELKAVVHQREVFDDAMSTGRGVVELNNPKARAEIEALAKGIYECPVSRSHPHHLMTSQTAPSWNDSQKEP